MEIIWNRNNWNKMEIVQNKYFNLLKSSGRMALKKYDKVMLSELTKKFPENIIVMYDNLLIDLTDFIKIHPGGKKLLNKNNLNEIGRYIHENQPISSKVKSHDHSFSAINYMMNSLIIGIYENTDFLIYKNENITNTELKTDSNNFDIYDFGKESECNNLKEKDIISKKLLTKFPILKGLENYDFYNDKVFFEEKSEISQKLWNVNFKLNGYKFPIFQKGVDWCGKYITLISEKSNVVRNYTICLCLHEKNQKKLKILEKNFIILEKTYEENMGNIDKGLFNNKTQNNTVDRSIIDNCFANLELVKINNLDKNDLISENFNLYIKSYSKSNGLSDEILKMKKGEHLFMRAPIVKIFILF